MLLPPTKVTSMKLYSSFCIFVFQIATMTYVNVGAADTPPTPLAYKFLYGAPVPVNTYQHTKF